MTDYHYFTQTETNFYQKELFLLRQTEQKGSVSGEVRIFSADFADKHYRENGVKTAIFLSVISPGMPVPFLALPYAHFRR